MMAAAAASATASVVQGIQGYQQGMHESQIAGQNARIAEDNAARARRDADMAEEAQRREARKQLGRAAAAGAQSGVAQAGPGANSLGAVMRQGAAEAELDALNIRYGGDTERTAFLTEAVQQRMERRAAIRRAKNAAWSGALGAASAGLSGYANYKGYQARRRLEQPTTTGPASRAPSPPKRVPTAARTPRIDPYHRNR